MLYLFSSKTALEESSLPLESGPGRDIDTVLFQQMSPTQHAAWAYQGNWSVYSDQCYGNPE